MGGIPIPPWGKVPYPQVVPSCILGPIRQFALVEQRCTKGSSQTPTQSKQREGESRSCRLEKAFYPQLQQVAAAEMKVLKEVPLHVSFRTNG